MLKWTVTLYFVINRKQNQENNVYFSEKEKI